MKARDNYVHEVSKEMMMSMKETKTPKGIFMSNLIMGAPLFTYAGLMLLMAPIASNATYVDSTQFAYMARSALRLLSLNISFFGGIHYGFAACNWEVAISEQDQKNAQRQMMLSFLPAVASISFSSYLLFAAPIQMHHIITSFTGLMVT